MRFRFKVAKDEHQTLPIHNRNGNRIHICFFKTFLGISYLIWALLCLIVLAVFIVIWVRKKAAPGVDPVRYFILRWFHALVWLLLRLCLHQPETLARLWQRYY